MFSINVLSPLHAVTVFGEMEFELHNVVELRSIAYSIETSTQNRISVFSHITRYMSSRAWICI